MPYVDILDDSAWPVVYARFRGTATVAEVTAYLQWYQARLDRARAAGVKIAAINDTTPGVTVSPEVRKFIADWLARIEDANTVCVADIVVIDSLAMRGVMTALRWVAPARLHGVLTAATVDEAWQTAVDRLAAYGVKAPVRSKSWSRQA